MRPNFVFFDACILFRKNNIYFIISFTNFVTIIIKKHNIPVIKLILAIQSKLCESWIETFELFTLKTQTHNFNLTETSKFYKLIIYLWLQEESLKKIYPASLDQRDWTILLVISHTKKNQKKFFFWESWSYIIRKLLIQ